MRVISTIFRAAIVLALSSAAAASDVSDRDAVKKQSSLKRLTNSVAASRKGECRAKGSSGWTCDWGTIGNYCCDGDTRDTALWSCSVRDRGKACGCNPIGTTCTEAVFNSRVTRCCEPGIFVNPDETPSSGVVHGSYICDPPEYGWVCLSTWNAEEQRPHDTEEDVRLGTPGKNALKGVALRLGTPGKNALKGAAL